MFDLDVRMVGTYLKANVLIRASTVFFNRDDLIMRFFSIDYCKNVLALIKGNKGKGNLVKEISSSKLQPNITPQNQQYIVAASCNQVCSRYIPIFWREDLLN